MPTGKKFLSILISPLGKANACFLCLKFVFFIVATTCLKKSLIVKTARGHFKLLPSPFKLKTVVGQKNTKVSQATKPCCSSSAQFLFNSETKQLSPASAEEQMFVFKKCLPLKCWSSNVTHYAWQKKTASCFSVEFTFTPQHSSQLPRKRTMSSFMRLDNCVWHLYETCFLNSRKSHSFQ